MKKILTCMNKLNPLSSAILRAGTRICLLMLAISLLLTYIQENIHLMNTTLIACAKVYPLLTLMVLSITITGALLIDIYDKTHKDRE